MTPNWATLDQWGFAAARYLLEALWQSTLVFAAVAALSAILRRYTPRARRALWLVALLIAPALPLLSTLAKPAGLPQQSVAAFPVYAPPPVIIELQPEPIVTPTVELPVATIAPPAPTPLDYPWALGLAAYTLGAAFFLAWTLLGHFRIYQWMRSGRAVSDPSVVEPFHRAVTRLNVRRPVRVVLTDRVPAPITAGIVRPTVLLPLNITDALTPDDLYAVALHETVHIQQREPLILTLASLIRSVLYFHPLVWLACRRLAVLAEHTADDAVLEITGAPTAYAKLLTTFAERLPLRTPATEGAAGLVFCKSAFLKRVEAILGDRNRVRKLTRIALACTVAAVLVSLAGALALPLGSKAQVALPASGGDAQTSEIAERVDTSSASSLTKGGEQPVVAQQSVREFEGETRSVQQEINVLERQRIGIQAKLDEAESSLRSIPRHIQDERESLERQLQLAEKDLERVSQMAKEKLVGQRDVEESEMTLQQLREKVAATKLAREKELNAPRLLLLKRLDDTDADLAALRARKEGLKNRDEAQRPPGSSEESGAETASREIRLRISEEEARCKVISEKLKAASSLVLLRSKDVEEEQTALERQLQLAGSDSKRSQQLFTQGLAPKLEADKKELVVLRLREKIAATKLAREEESSESLHHLKSLLSQAEMNVGRLKAEQAEIDKRVVKPVDTGASEDQGKSSNAKQKVDASDTSDVKRVHANAASPAASSELAPRISRDDASGFELHVTDGTHPAAGAHVVLAKPGWELRFEEGEFKEAYDRGKRGNAPSVKTGADGKCILPPMEGPFMLAVVHPTGYAICGCDEALAKGTLVLTPWASLQGTLRLSGVLCPDMKLQIQRGLEFDCIGKPLIRPVSNAADAIAMNFHALAQTDAAAHFESKHLPAGNATLSPVFPTGEKDGLAPVVGLQGSVALEAGKTAKYDFGETRSTVTGKFDPNQTPMDWSAIKATLRLEAPHIGLDGDEVMWKVQGDFAKSPMGKLYNPPITIYSDGSFCLDEVPEGRYQLIAFGPSGSNYASSNFSLPPTDAKPQTTGPLSINLAGPDENRPYPKFSYQAKDVTSGHDSTLLEGDVKCAFGETGVTADQAEFGKSMRKFTFTGAVTLTTKTPDGKTVTTHSNRCEIDSDYKAHFTGNVSFESEKGKGKTKSLTLDLRTGEFQMDGPSAGAAQIESNAPAASAPEGAQSTIEQALAKTVSLKMERTHLTNVAEELARQTGAKIVVDSTVVAPPNEPKEDTLIPRYVSDGTVPYIDLKNVTLKQVLKALTRPMGLGFAVSGDSITITTPSQTADGDTNALDKRITVSWPDTTLGEAVDAIVNASDISIVLDNQSADPKTQVKAASYDNQTLKSVLDPLVQPLNLEYALRKDFIWISTPQRIATDPFGKSSLSAAQDPEFFVSTEIKVIEARHTFGNDALHNLKPLANARRLEGDAMVFTGPEVHLGSLTYPLTRERMFDRVDPQAAGTPTASSSTATLSTNRGDTAPETAFELISAPRITTGPLRTGLPKIVLSNRTKLPENNGGYGGGGGSTVRFQKMPPEGYLFDSFNSGFLKPVRVDSPNHTQMQPGYIADVTTKPDPRSDRAKRKGPANAEFKDPCFGVACGVALTALTDTNELNADIMFRMRSLLDENRAGADLVSADNIEEIAFRYVIQCKPDEVIGFALPYRNRGHLFVIVTFDYPRSGAAFRPGPTVSPGSATRTISSG